VPDLTFEEYQTRTTDTAAYPDAGTGDPTAISYVILALCGEAGELAGKWKKMLRGDHGEVALTPEFRATMEQEVGDVTWYLARVCEELGLDFGIVAQANLDKLASRKTRGALHGSGDNR